MSAVEDGGALRAQVLELQIRIAQDRATFEEELKFARSIIIELQENHDWIRGVADSRQDRIVVLKAELSTARLQLEALMSSGHKEKWRIGRVVMTLLTGVGSVAGLSGFSLKDAVERPNNPLSAIVVTLSPEDCRALGLEQPHLPTGTGAANVTVTADVRAGGSLNAEFQAGSAAQDEARADDSVTSIPRGSVVHDEARANDSVEGPRPFTLDESVLDGRDVLGDGASPPPASREENTDRMVQEFLRQRINERSNPVVPETIAEGLPLGLDEVHSSLRRLFEAGAIEGVEVGETDYPVQVTRVR